MVLIYSFLGDFFFETISIQFKMIVVNLKLGTIMIGFATLILSIAVFILSIDRMQGSQSYCKCGTKFFFYSVLFLKFANGDGWSDTKVLANVYIRHIVDSTIRAQGFYKQDRSSGAAGVWWHHVHKRKTIMFNLWGLQANEKEKPENCRRRPKIVWAILLVKSLIRAGSKFLAP